MARRAGENAAPRNPPLDHREAPVKFQPDRAEGVNTISRHEPGRIWVGAEAHPHSVLVPWQGPVRPWRPAAADDPAGATAGVPGSLAELATAHFEAVLALAPELVVFGSGTRLQFVPPAMYRALIDAGVGLETMDTAAACRTFNVLASEGRSVVAALLVGPPPR